MTSGKIYHIYNHANGTENLFKEEENYRYFLQQYEKYVFPLVDTYAYCLLPNHFHFLLRVKEYTELQNLPGFKNLAGLEEAGASQKVIKCFSNLFNSYTKAFNKKFERRGSLFEKSFKRKLINDEAQFQDTFLYINLNAVKHGLVGSVDKWKWSSWKSYLEMNQGSLLERSTGIDYFDNFDNLKYCMEEKAEQILNMNLE